MIDFLQLFNNIWNADRLMEGWTDGDYTILPGEKWNIVYEYSIASSFNNEKHWKWLKYIGTDLYSNLRMCLPVH